VQAEKIAQIGKKVMRTPAEMLKLVEQLPWTRQILVAQSVDDKNARLVTVLNSYADKQRYLAGRETVQGYLKVTYEFIEDTQVLPADFVRVIEEELGRA
jgi:hypothetical protein